MKKDFRIIGFDADDTLWINEPYFQETEKQFCEMLSAFYTADIISQELFKTEMQNLNLYGFGAKGFMLSMIETALRISDHKVPQSTIDKIIQLGKELLNKPVVLLDGVEEVLDNLHKKGIELIVATKGDLLDQERKLKKSNIEKYFHHVEIMSDKKESDYLKLLSHLDIKPENFLMVGNSLKSDIIPVLNIGGFGIHVPYHTTWQHEKTEEFEKQNNFREIEHISELIKIC
ncbi:MAG: HAD family hydrolase [Ignavibacteriaceae bacterium]|jgi:putative hydrolase of the HAD superfamily|nr:HAD family hydrolase [Ignavibacteriaceae bacterium]